LPCKFVVGTGPALDWAVAAWREVAPELEIRAVRLEQDASAAVHLAQLDALDQIEATAFVVGDEKLLNIRRLELMGAMKSRGFAMPPLICRGAIVADGASVSENTYVGSGAILGHGCQVGFNVMIGAGANLGSGSRIGNSAWIEAGVLIGREASIAANVTIGAGVIIGAGIVIGKFCIIDKPGYIRADMVSKTFLHASHGHPIVIVGQ
jgi:UDP-3-O-[3-hydroxymyristoyl] glucosamine N-acyltransferase